MALVASSGGKRDMGSKSEFAITSYTEDLAMAGNDNTASSVAATLATLIKVLIENGVINGTVNS